MAQLIGNPRIKMGSFTVSGHIIDVVHKKIFPGTVCVECGKISAVAKETSAPEQYILPGFIDAHIHVESSMLVPSEFARLAVLHGTVATISDPHEIGNVLGLKGIRYMLENSQKVPLNIFFGASPCIPATAFENSGAAITPEDIRTLFTKDKLTYLSEMMNYPGVLSRDSDVMAKIAIAKAMKKPIDGHSPGLRGEKAKDYIDAGITTDHECYTLEEALEKIHYGMKILIREGSAAKNYNALHPLIKLHPQRIMFCSDDKHPDDLLEGHINQIVKRSVALGYDLMDVLRAACLNPIEHYGLELGLLQSGDPADFIVVNNLKDFGVVSTYIKGQLVASEGKSLIASVPIETVNHFNCTPKRESDFQVKAGAKNINVIQAVPGELITKRTILPAKILAGNYTSDIDRDILKLVVVNRYRDAPPAVAFIKGMGLQAGALASSIAHDSHNIVAVGVDDAALCRAVNAVIKSKGGISVAQNDETTLLALPVAGLMSDRDGWQVAAEYAAIKHRARSLGASLPDPYMALSFLALLVIPALKLSDRGLFDAEAFRFMPLSAD